MAVVYSFDPGLSRFTVQAFATGMLSVFAHSPVITVRDFRGEMYFTPEAPEDASLELTMRADSLEVTGNINPKDRPEIESRMRGEVLQTARYPEISYRSRRISAVRTGDGAYRLRIQGDLSLSGVTNAHVVEAQLQMYADGIRLRGEFGLLLSAYRIPPVTALGGLIKVKDELRFWFDLGGWKKDDSRSREEGSERRD